MMCDVCCTGVAYYIYVEHSNQALGGLTGHQHAVGSSSAIPSGVTAPISSSMSSGGGMVGATLRLVKEEGLRGMFRGVEVQVVRGCLGAGEWRMAKWRCD